MWLSHRMPPICSRSTLERVSPRLIPNCENCSTPTELDDWNSGFREDFGFSKENLIFVQPTPVLFLANAYEDSVRLLGFFTKIYLELAPRIHFVISLYQGDELNGEYIQKSVVWPRNRRFVFILLPTESPCGVDSMGKARNCIPQEMSWLMPILLPIYLIWEGFGNACLEAVSSLVPIVITTYLIYKTDIQCAGFRNIEIRDKYGCLIINDEIYSKMQTILMDNNQREKMTAHNFQTAQKEFGFDTLRSSLKNLIADYSDEMRTSRKRLVKSMTHYSV